MLLNKTNFLKETKYSLIRMMILIAYLEIIQYKLTIFLLEKGKLLCIFEV